MATERDKIYFRRLGIKGKGDRRLELKRAKISSKWLGNKRKFSVK